jgi:acyl-coenzyme A synthetase/AMP-(fatty) acid ligase
VVTPFPGAIETKPGSATVPFFGIEPAILDPKTGEVRLLALDVTVKLSDIFTGARRYRRSRRSRDQASMAVYCSYGLPRPQTVP